MQQRLLKQQRRRTWFCSSSECLLYACFTLRSSSIVLFNGCYELLGSLRVPWHQAGCRGKTTCKLMGLRGMDAILDDPSVPGLSVELALADDEK